MKAKEDDFQEGKVISESKTLEGRFNVCIMHYDLLKRNQNRIGFIHYL